jgi:hypothetical protein
MNDIFLKSFEKKNNLYLSSSKNIYYRVKKKQGYRDYQNQPFNILEVNLKAKLIPSNGLISILMWKIFILL